MMMQLLKVYYKCLFQRNTDDVNISLARFAGAPNVHVKLFRKISCDMYIVDQKSERNSL